MAKKRHLLKLKCRFSKFKSLLVHSNQKRRRPTSFDCWTAFSSRGPMNHSDPPPARRPSFSISCEDAEETIFDQLPLELLLSVFSHLPMSSVLSLALTNRRMLCTINENTDIWEAIRIPKNAFERAKFLVANDELHPDEFICYLCGVFHPRTETRPIKKNGKQSKKTEVVSFKCPRGVGYTYPLCNIQVSSRHVFHDNGFKWGMMYEAMRGLRYSPRYGNPHLLNLEVPAKSPRSWVYDTASLQENGCLLLRARRYCGFDEIGEHEFASFPYDILCPHFSLSITRPQFESSLRDTMKQSRRLDRVRGPKGLVNCGYRCKECPIEIVLSVYLRADFFHPRQPPDHAPDSKYILCVTQYAGVGACKSPDEIEWESMTSRFRLPKDPRLSQPGFQYLYSREEAPREEWPSINVTHLEPIWKRFARLLPQS